MASGKAYPEHDVVAVPKDVDHLDRAIDLDVGEARQPPRVMGWPRRKLPADPGAYEIVAGHFGDDRE